MALGVCSVILGVLDVAVVGLHAYTCTCIYIDEYVMVIRVPIVAQCCQSL